MSTTYQTGNATKENILQQSRLLFYQKGYQATTYTDISLAAGVNRALIPYHFQNKSTLGKAVYREILAQACTLLDNILDIQQFSSDFAGMLHLMVFYHLLENDKFSRFCIQLSEDAGNNFFDSEMEQSELSPFIHPSAALSPDTIELLEHMHMGIKQQMIQYIHLHSNTDTMSIAKMHMKLLLRYTGHSPKKCDELVESACEVVNMLHFELNEFLQVTVSYR